MPKVLTRYFSDDQGKSMIFGRLGLISQNRATKSLSFSQ